MRATGEVILVCLLSMGLAGCSDTTTEQSISPSVPAGSEVNVSQAAAVPQFEGKWVDLSWAFGADTIYWPGGQPFELEVLSAGVTEGGYYYAANAFQGVEHAGTHIDAPIHFFAERRTVDKIPVGQLIGEAVVVDVSRQCATDRDYQVQTADLVAWEEEHRRQLVDVIVLLRTGFGEYWPDRERYLGTTDTTQAGIAELHFPGLHPDAARWLVEQRMIKAIGIDTASIDYGQSTRYQSHITLFEHNVPALENVAHLEELPEQGALVIALPMKIAGGSGGPVRIVALVPEE